MAYQVRRPAANTYLVRERDRRRMRELSLVLLVVVSLGGGLLAYTWIQLEVLRTGYRVFEMERELHDLEQQEREHQIEAARLASPRRIDEQARQELGLAPADAGRIVRLERR